MRNIRFVGLDVHADSIAVAVAEAGGEVRSLGSVPNQESAVRRLIRRLGERKKLRVCYEAGPTGYVVYWWLSRLDRSFHISRCRPEGAALRLFFCGALCPPDQEGREPEQHDRTARIAPGNPRAAGHLRLV